MKRISICLVQNLRLFSFSSSSSFIRVPSIKVTHFEKEIIDPASLEGPRLLIAPAELDRSTHPLTPVRLQQLNNSLSPSPFTLQQNLRRASILYSKAPALAIKRNSQWCTWTYKEYFEAVNQTARGFLSLELQPGESVGIMGPNCPEWFFSSLGVIFAGGLSTGIYTTSSPDTVSYIVKNGNAKFLVFENERLLHKIVEGKSIREVFPEIRNVIFMEESTYKEDDIILNWKDLMDLGNRISEDKLKEVERNQSANKACLLIYTSGTTGKAKGALISHDNLTWSSKAISNLHERQNREIILSFMPLSHVAAQVLDITVSTYRGACVTFADKDALKGSLGSFLKEVEPSGLLSVPRVYEKMHEKLQNMINKLPHWKKMVLSWAQKQAIAHYQKVRSTQNNCKPSLSYLLAKKYIFKNIHKQMGLARASIYKNSIGNTAAPLSSSLIDFYESIDLPLGDIFGATETTGCLTWRMLGMNKNVLGHALPGIDCRILSPDENGAGELVIKGRNVFMGYLNDEIKTKEAFTSDGYFRTGDLVALDESQYLELTGRIKDIIITAGGKNIAPTNIESTIKSSSLSSLLSNVVVIGDNRPFLIALFTLRVLIDSQTSLPSQTLDAEAKNWCRKVLQREATDVPSTVEEFLKSPHFSTFEKAVMNTLESEVNSKVESNPFKIRKWKILPRDFSIATGEFGPTLKLKRSFISTIYSKEISEVYKNESPEKEK